MKTLRLAAVLAITLAGCDTADLAERPAIAGSTGNAMALSPPSGAGGLSLVRLGPGQRAALKQGCRQRYGRDAVRYNQCLSGAPGSEQALEHGCAMRYAGNPTRISLCQGL
ncbi:MAG TPA: hypothetical protein VD978_02975 [Azospirillum sp.]|nr:hypothetical protein [Azospirillum sp.]